MSTTITAVFDGRVLRPDVELDLQPNARYAVTIDPTPVSEPAGDAWDVLEQLAGTVDAPPDWSSEHDHYLYGVPKRASHEQA